MVLISVGRSSLHPRFVSFEYGVDMVERCIKRELNRRTLILIEHDGSEIDEEIINNIFHDYSSSS